MNGPQAKPNVVLVSPFFSPEKISTGRYNTHLARALSDLGAAVTVICSYPFYPEWAVREAGSEVDGIKVLRGGRWIHYPNSQSLRRLVLELWYRRFVKKSLRELSYPPDLILEVFPPALFASTIRKWRPQGVPTVGIVHDLLGVMSASRPTIFRRLVGALIRPLERQALKSCDRLIFLSEAMRNFAIDSYRVDSARCDVAYPFCSLPKERSRELRTPEALNGRKNTLVYSGALGEKQDPEQLLQLMDRFAHKRADYDVFVFSDGPIFVDLARRYSQDGSPVQFNALVPDTEIEGLLRASTIQIIPQRLGLSHGAFPSKLPNLLSVGTAIFAIADADSEVTQIVNQYSRGKAIATWSIDRSLAALETFASEVGAASKHQASTQSDIELQDRFDLGHFAQGIYQMAVKSMGNKLGNH